MTSRSLAAVSMVIAWLMVGCQQPDRPPESPRVIRDIYGLSITMGLRDATGAEEFYRVDRDGMLGFGGGMDARFSRTPYTAMLAAEDMNRLADVVAEQRLIDERLESSNQPRNARYTLRIRTDRGSIHRTIRGTNDRLEALRTVLREFANRRLLPELERQPKPSIERQVPVPP